MNQQDFEALDARVSARAVLLWSDAGSPEGGPARYVDQARELTAMSEVELPGFDPEAAARPVVEEASIQGNLGEFPTLRDQGDEQTYPDPNADDDIHLSDGDASDQGGVLPTERMAVEDLPEVSLADADMTASVVNADDGPLNDDLNDDGLPDTGDPDDDYDDEDPAEDALEEVDIAIDPDRSPRTAESYEEDEESEEDNLPSLLRRQADASDPV